MDTLNKVLLGMYATKQMLLIIDVQQELIDGNQKVSPIQLEVTELQDFFHITNTKVFPF